MSEQPKDWSQLSKEARNIMAELGSFGPTVSAADRQVKGYTIDSDGDAGKTYYDSAGLRLIAKACVEVADWLDARALAEGE